MSAPELGIVVLLPEAVPDRADFLSRELTGWADLTAALEELENFEPRWRAVTVAHAEDLPALMAEGELKAPIPSELRRLLNELDGQLGLAVYRGEGSSEEWKTEARELIARIRKALAA